MLMGGGGGGGGHLLQTQIANCTAEHLLMLHNIIIMYTGVSCIILHVCTIRALHAHTWAISCAGLREPISPGFPLGSVATYTCIEST